jgi:hypothetical protein
MDFSVEDTRRGIHDFVETFLSGFGAHWRVARVHGEATAVVKKGEAVSAARLAELLALATDSPFFVSFRDESCRLIEPVQDGMVYFSCAHEDRIPPARDGLLVDRCDHLLIETDLFDS